MIMLKDRPTLDQINGKVTSLDIVLILLSLKFFGVKSSNIFWNPYVVYYTMKITRFGLRIKSNPIAE